MIKIKKLTYSYPGAPEPALKGIEVEIAAGEFVGIIGPTGAGKSTLTMCLNGVIPHFQPGDYYGEVLVDGRDTVENDCASLAASIGSVFQDPEAQLVAPVVEDEIIFGLENLNIPSNEIAGRVAESLELAGISGLRHSSTARLSGGQKQRVAIAAAIALRPRILVLDEPTSELDPRGSVDIFDTLNRLNHQFGITVIVVEQKIQLLAEYCSRLLVMDRGRLILDGSTGQVLSNQGLLQELGVNSPPVTRLAYLLQEAGLYRGELPVNVEQASLIINQLLFGNQSINRRGYGE